jgi:four helix bundle protein
MPTTFTYRDLDVWKQAMDLVEQCYRTTAGFPGFELYGLTSQLRRAAVSIPSNIAEGHCRRTTRAYANHVSIALGSHGELETCIELSARLGFLKKLEATRLLNSANSVGRLLNGLYRSLEEKLASNSEGNLRP